MLSAFVRHALIATAAFAATLGVIAVVVLGFPKTPITVPDVPLSAEHQRMLEQWVTLKAPILLRKAQSGSFNTPLPLAFAKPALVLHADRGAGLMEAIDHHLRDDIAVPAEALLRQALADLFGDDLSPARDVLPMMQEEVMVQARAMALASGNDTIQFLIAGTMDDPLALDRHLTRLHDLFRSSLPLVKQENRTFSEGWTFSTVRADPAAIAATEHSEGRWNIRSTAHRESGRAFLTAQDDRSYVLTNDPATFEAYTGNIHGSLSVPHRGGAFVVGGLLDADAAGPLLELLKPDNAEMPITSGTYIWGVSQEDGKIIITISPSPYPLPSRERDIL